MATLAARAFPTLAEVDPVEADFLGSVLRDLLRTARAKGFARLVFHDYELIARRESLGAVLVALSWTITRNGKKIASDTAIRGR